MDSLRLAKVAAVHPEANAVDLIFLSGGGIVPLVQVMSPSASTNTGLADLAQPAVPASGDKYDLTDTGTRDIIAVVGFFMNQPVVLGFLFPQVCQMLFADLERRVARHASDVYTSIDKDGNTEYSHPSGSYSRFGVDPEHEDLTGKDFDAQWKITRNTDKAVHFQLTIKNAGVQKASLNIDPTGNVTLDHVGNLTGNTGGNADLTIAGDATAAVTGNLSATVGGTTDVTSGGNAALHAPQINLDAPLTICTGALQVAKTLQVQNTGGATSASSMSGTINITGGDVVADGIGLKPHHHVEHDGPSTGPAVA